MANVIFAGKLNYSVSNMTEGQKASIIESGKEYFRTIIIPNHVEKFRTLRLKDFNVNPFTINYLAAFS